MCSDDVLANVSMQPSNPPNFPHPANAIYLVDMQHSVSNQAISQSLKQLEYHVPLQVQEFRTGATKQNMEVTHIREENKKITKQMSDLRGKLADHEARVSVCASLVGFHELLIITSCPVATLNMYIYYF